MIGTINIKVSASRPNMPLGPFHVFAGSAASFTIVDIPLPLGVRKVTGVTLAAKNVAGVTTGFAAVRVGSAWGVTVPPSHFAASGTVERGVSILATGVDDAGDAVTPWKLGAGDVYVMEPDGSVAPGETVHDLHWHDVRPANPVGGDVAPYDGAVWYFNGTEWIRWASTGDVSHDDFDGIDELASADSIGKVKETVNMVIRKLKGSAVAVVAAALCWSVYADALGPSTILDDVPGTNTIGDIVRAGGGGGGVGAVASVNGKTGTVELVAADVGALPDSYVPPPAPVRSVNGKTGAVSLNYGDVGAWDGRYEVAAALALGYHGRNWFGGAAPYSLTWDSTEKRFKAKWPIEEIPTSRYMAYLSDLDGYVPTSRKVNGKPLTQDISIEGMSDNALVLTNGSVKTKSGTAISASAVGAFPAASGQTLQQAVQVISLHLNAEDARDIVTNYNSAVNMPSRRLEYKEPDGPNAGTWRVVWDELTRWNWLTGTYLPSNFYTKAEVDARTDHVQWGLFDSQTGNFSPDKTVQISSDRVILCKGASYQRTATASGTYFVWTSNEPYSITGVESNGYFRIEDAEGNTTFEIVKGDKVTAAATAGGVSTEDVVGITHLHIRYPIEADTHPTLEICNNLATHDWKAETDPDCKANVTWTGVSGNYTAEVWGKSAESALFVKATYERGSDPYVRYAQAIALQTVKIGNTVYYVGTATISGHTVLTLSLTPQ